LQKIISNRIEEQVALKMHQKYRLIIPTITIIQKSGTKTGIITGKFPVADCLAGLEIAALAVLVRNDNAGEIK
jgi:hypothetical protein